MAIQRVKNLSVVCLVLLWITTLAMPVATTRLGLAPATIMTGASIAGMGWLGPFDLQFGWYANPLFAAALYVVLNEGSESGKSLIALGTLLLLPTASAMFWRSVLLDEGGGRARAVDFHAGYFLWLSVMLMAAGLAIWTGVERYNARFSE